MPRFLFVYRVPPGYVPARPAVMAAWQDWFTSMGASMVDQGNAVHTCETVGVSGGDSSLAGYSIVTAEDMSAAVALAEGCPVLADGGGVEVGLLVGPGPS